MNTLVHDRPGLILEDLRGTYVAMSDVVRKGPQPSAPGRAFADAQCHPTGEDQMLDVKKLQILLAVAQHGSVTTAATVLGYTPSAVSQQLLRLEREVGQPLMHRRPWGMDPTDAGQLLVGHAARMLRYLVAAESELHEVRSARIVLGTSPSLASSFLPQVVSQFRQRHPEIRLEIRTERQRQLKELLEDGTVDLAVLWDYAWNRINPSQLDLTELFHDPTVLVVAADHRFARRHQVAMSDLADEDWISRRDHPIVEVLRRSALKAGFEAQVSLHVDDYHEAQAMVGVGLGVTLAPRSAVMYRVPHVRVVALTGTVPARRINLAQRCGDHVRPPAHDEFKRLLADAAASWTITSKVRSLTQERQGA
jgi:DNA-binding transcriptional LysR family regulator